MCNVQTRLRITSKANKQNACYMFILAVTLICQRHKVAPVKHFQPWRRWVFLIPCHHTAVKAHTFIFKYEILSVILLQILMKTLNYPAFRRNCTLSDKSAVKLIEFSLLFTLNCFNLSHTLKKFEEVNFHLLSNCTHVETPDIPFILLILSFECAPFESNTKVHEHWAGCVYVSWYHLKYSHYILCCCFFVEQEKAN